VALTSVGADLRVAGAAITAALVAFALSAAVDWVWQVPVLPVAVMLLGAAVLVPGAGRPGRIRRNWPTRVALVACALLCLVAIGIPLAATSALRSSQAAASAGELATAAADAASAVRLEPDGAAARLQLALVDEAQGDLNAAVAQARRSAADEPANWQPWFVLSRLQAESGHAGAALASYRHARSLDPHSPLFRS
jgi:tetratricopeptide (TPR) repeat protein